MPHGRLAKKRRLTPPINDDLLSETVPASELFHRAADWELEDTYAQKKRQTKTKEPTRLPLKRAADGTIRKAAEPEVEDAESDSFLGSGSEHEREVETPPTDVISDESPALPLKEQIFAVKEDLARCAGLINEDPEEHVGLLKKLAGYGDARHHASVRKLAFATQVAVYEDLIPGYRIRHYGEEDLGREVSKDIRRTRQYEQALVSSYRDFVTQLASVAKDKEEDADVASLRTVAISCVCALLKAVPHFNFRTELLNVIVRELSRRTKSDDYRRCVEGLQSFFDEDEDGAPSFEAVGLLTKMMKARNYQIREELLNTILHLRLLSELTRESLDKPKNEESPLKLHGRKIKKQKQEHRSKKDRKVAKERKAVEKDMKEANAIVNYEERDKLQSETLKLVFATYFRILKARPPHLMGAVLEGLARYAHLINQDLFGDLLEALREIVEHAEQADAQPDEEDESLDATQPRRSRRNLTREALLSTQTAFTLLSNQNVAKSAGALHLDLSFFTSYIYRNLHRLALDADLEGHQPDLSSSTSPSNDNNTNTTNSSLLLSILTSILLPTKTPPPPPNTLAALTKRLLTCTLHTPEPTTSGLLTLLQKLSFHPRHGRILSPLFHSDERKGDGVYQGASESMEGTNVWSVGSGVWEGELLRWHYVKGVRGMWRGVEGGVGERVGG